MFNDIFMFLIKEKKLNGDDWTGMCVQVLLQGGLQYYRE